MTDQAVDPAAPPVGDAGIRDIAAILKPRVMSLVIFTALTALIVAPGGLHPVEALAAILCIAAGAGASGALNMWWDADIDARMRRTRARPVPTGRVAAGEALGIGLGLSLISVMMLGLAANWLAAALLALTIFHYAVVYSMWLKRRTPQNIVIGGLAGALPPLIGWAAVTGGIAPAPLLMVLLIFMWTPPHFWALALFVRGDYAAVGVPMLTVTHGQAATRRHILAYSVLLAPVAIALALSSAGGPVTLVAAVVLNGAFLWRAWQVARRGEPAAESDGYRAEKRFFGLSITYLFGHFAALLGDAALAAMPFWTG